MSLSRTSLSRTSLSRTSEPRDQAQLRFAAALTKEARRAQQDFCIGSAQPPMAVESTPWGKRDPGVLIPPHTRVVAQVAEWLQQLVRGWWLRIRCKWLVRE